MKSILKYSLLFCLVIILLGSCEEYLDKTPEAGLSETDVFGKYENFLNYVQGLYSGEKNAPLIPSDKTMGWWPWAMFNGHPLFFTTSTQRASWDCYTEVGDGGRGMSGLTWKTGSLSPILFIYTQWRVTPILIPMFEVIRRSNNILEKLHMLTDATEQQKDDFKGQAHFARAYANFVLLRTWGPMPYFTKVIGPDDEWDPPRLQKYPYLLNIAADFDTAYYYFEKAGVMRRDNPVPGAPGHLTHPDMFRPNGCAALALKGRALLYAASPLNNGGMTGQPWEEPIGEGQVAWENAAKANWEALQAALNNGYELLSLDDFRNNYVGVPYTNEQIWAWTTIPTAVNHRDKSWLLCGNISGLRTPNCNGPTQNAIDRFETAWGDPMNTETDRQAAISIGRYNPQDPYKPGTLDPRFYHHIMYNGQTIPSFGTAKIYYEYVNGTLKYSDMLDPYWSGNTITGYMIRKQWGGENRHAPRSTTQTDPLIRLAEIYLNYAEATNEAYGPNTPAPGASLTAVQAVNIIRERFGHVPVQTRFTTDKSTFRERIKNEWFVEFCYEGHFWFFNTRRWMDAPELIKEGQTMMDIEKLSAGYDPIEYPTGYRYTRLRMPDERQPVWKDAMYYFCFDELDHMQKMNKFIPNIVW